MVKLLVVDDEKILCTYMKEFFSKRGYSVFTANSGEEAIKILNRQKPQLVFLDIEMGKVSGLEVLKKIKEIDPQIKVIMITVRKDEDALSKAKELGADEYITKPFRMSYLEDVVILKVDELISDQELLKKKFKILIVDDEEGMRQTIIGYLNRRLNCEFIEAQSGEEALDKIKKDKPNLVLLDIKMRGISGLEVIKQIAQIDKDIPILVITAWDSEEIATQVVKEGAVDYVPKPFSAQVLLMKIKGLLKYKQKLTSG